MNVKVTNNREVYDNKYTNEVLNKLQIYIFEAFNKIYTQSIHTCLGSDCKFKVYCYNDNNENVYNVQVSISYNIFNDTYIARLNILENDYTNINNIYLEFTTEEILQSLGINDIYKVIKDFIDKYYNI